MACHWKTCDGNVQLEAQGTLLRVLEGGRFMRLGGKDEIKTDVRLVTATNRNLPRMVREGKFREDLSRASAALKILRNTLRKYVQE